MTASELARVFNAKRVGRGKWIAKCPAHPDKHPSLSIAEGKRVPVVIRCMSLGCAPEDILKAAGLTWQDLFDGKPTPEIRRKVSQQDRKEALERQLGLVLMLQVTDASKSRYWAGAERRIRGELFWVRWELEPGRVEEEILKWHSLRKNGRSTSSKRSTDATSRAFLRESLPRTTSLIDWSA